MARSPQAGKVVAEVRPYIEGVAKNLVDRIYGPHGPAWGTRMTELEDVVVAVREALSEKMLEQVLARQATATEQRPAEYQNCPGCRGGVEAHAPEPRNVHTRGGEARWHEPHEYCPKCRRAFFPSESQPGD